MPGKSASDRGWLMHVIVPFSGAFMGNARETFSNNQKPSHLNNAVLAAAANALTGGVDVDPNFAGKLRFRPRGVTVLSLWCERVVVD